MVYSLPALGQSPVSLGIKKVAGLMRRMIFRFLTSCWVISVFYGATVPCIASSPVTLSYWEKWTSFEGEAMRRVVEAFNESQEHVSVELMTVSEMDRKLLVAIAGNDPPDIAGLWSWALVPYAQKGALTCLDDYAQREGITRDQYIGAYWDQCLYQGSLFALPSVPASIALHWNKDLFEAAGLDPDVPPATLAELDDMARRLTLRNDQGKIIQMGFLPPEPGWWNWAWGYWFGGSLWDGEALLTPDSPENIAAYEWVQGYAKEYGLQSVDNFRGGFGNFSSPQNAFLCGKVAMVLQGVWMSNFIDEYAPQMKGRWGAAPFPSAIDGLSDVTIIEEDILVIPKGARYPNEAFQFLAFVNSQKGSELLAMGQKKFPPLKEISPSFVSSHPNPFIQVFIDLAKSPNAYTPPMIGIWNEYGDEINARFEEIWLQQISPAEGLRNVRERMQGKLDRELARERIVSHLVLGPVRTSTRLSGKRIYYILGVLLTICFLLVWPYLHRNGPTRRSVQLRNGLLFVSPWILGFLIFVAYPVAASLYYAFTDFSVLMPAVFVGFTNFMDLFEDEVFWKSTINTFYYALFALPMGMVTALALALLLNNNVRGMTVYRTIFLLPALVPLVALAILWMWILNSQYGVLNSILSSLGLHGPSWLNDTRWSKPAIILTGLWGVGQSMVIYLASLQDVPQELYEACELDGGGSAQKIWHVTIPMISPVIYFSLVMGIIGTLQIFAVPYIMTGGGPARSTLFYSMYLYDNAFRYLRMGYACAMAWILFVAIVVLTLIATRFSSKHIHYAAR